MLKSDCMCCMAPDLPPDIVCAGAAAAVLRICEVYPKREDRIARMKLCEKHAAILELGDQVMASPAEISQRDQCRD